MTYVYRCPACGSILEPSFKMGEAPAEILHTDCDVFAQRVYTPVPTVFKWERD